MKRNTIEFIAGSVIKEEREARGVKLAAIEMKTNICISKLSKIESGRQLLDLKTLHALSKEYGITMTSIMAIIESKFDTSFTLPNIRKRKPNKSN